jgi:hypothetical protein
MVVAMAAMVVHLLVVAVVAMDCSHHKGLQLHWKNPNLSLECS